MTPVLSLADLPEGSKKTVSLGDTEILLLHHNGDILAFQAKCPHAGAPLAEGAVCNGRLVCPWHMGEFALPSGALVEPPPMAPLKRFPVEIRGTDIHVSPDPIPGGDPIDPAPVEAPHTGSTPDQRRFVLIGAGAAGSMAARTLRLSGFTGTITAVDPVPDEPVDRTLLSKFALSGKKPLEKAPLGTLHEDHVDRITASVTRLSAARSEVTLSTGETIPFDAALVATGGKPKRPNLPGADLAHVIRHTADVARILDQLGPPATDAKPGETPNLRQAVVLGTSFLGMEAAASLTERGVAVTVIGEHGTPFAEKFGERIGHSILDLHKSQGVSFRLGAETQSITATGVTLSTGEVLPADLVLLATGVEPELSFEHDLPLAQKGGGIAVTTSLQAAPAVWVAGDISSVDGTRIEHWRLAEQHGMVAARAMLGEAASYTGVPFFWTAHFGKRFSYLGHAEEWDEIVYDGDPETLTFLAFFLRHGHVAAVFSCNRNTATATLAELLHAPLTLAEAQAAIA